jgi:hypothetical protein
VTSSVVADDIVGHVLRRSHRTVPAVRAGLAEQLGRLPARESGAQDLVDARGRKYPAIVKLWENAWEEFTPFLRPPPAEIRKATNVPYGNAFLRGRLPNACGHATFRPAHVGP